MSWPSSSVPSQNSPKGGVKGAPTGSSGSVPTSSGPTKLDEQEEGERDEGRLVGASEAPQPAAQLGRRARAPELAARRRGQRVDNGSLLHVHARRRAVRRPSRPAAARGCSVGQTSIACSRSAGGRGSRTAGSAGSAARRGRAPARGRGPARRRSARACTDAPGRSRPPPPGRSPRCGPRYITAIRSAMKRAAARSWVTNTTAMPSSRRSLPIRLSTVAASETSSELVGSSQRSTGGGTTIARAIATRCCWPPDSWCGRCSATSGGEPDALEGLAQASAGLAARARPALRSRSVICSPTVQPRGQRRAGVLEDHLRALLAAPPRPSRRPRRSARPRSAEASTCRSRSRPRARRTRAGSRRGRCRGAP